MIQKTNQYGMRTVSRNAVSPAGLLQVGKIGEPASIGNTFYSTSPKGERRDREKTCLDREKTSLDIKELDFDFSLCKINTE